MTNVTSNNPYDEVPYNSYPFAYSSPENLRTLGVLFGMQPPALETARVLELGCSEGGNIIPLALKYPKAHYVGVDLSKVQIDNGLKQVKDLGLKNIELKAMSIVDIDASFGKFDYIISHGVLSWVPKFVQKKIFEISANNLTENGISYISYNTLPGWNTLRTIRDMMLYHTRDFKNPQEKAAQARFLLEFVKDSLEGQNSPYSDVLRQESEMLSKQSDFYLIHEHLEDENKQFYFSEFMKHANDHNLQYLSDCSLSSMYLGNMPKNVIEKLQNLNDIVRTEQYMDFITNRRFRSTLLCHKNIRLNRNLTNEHAKKFSMTLNVIPEKPLSKVDLNDTKENLKFFLNGNQENNIASSSPYLKSALYVFSENRNNPLSFDSIVALANEKLGNNKKAEIERDLLSNLMGLVVKGYLILVDLPEKTTEANLEKPKALKLATYQATNSANTWVTNSRHTPIAINIFEKTALKYMDGKNERKVIIDNLLKDVQSGAISLNRDNKKIEDTKELQMELAKFLDASITRLSNEGILI